MKYRKRKRIKITITLRDGEMTIVIEEPPPSR